jgi:hypothetical protein
MQEYMEWLGLIIDANFKKVQSILEGCILSTSGYALRVSMGGGVKPIKPTVLALLYMKFRWDYYYIINF